MPTPSFLGLNWRVLIGSLVIPVLFKFLLVNRMNIQGRRGYLIDLYVGMPQTRVHVDPRVLHPNHCWHLLLLRRRGTWLLLRLRRLLLLLFLLTFWAVNIAWAALRWCGRSDQSVLYEWFCLGGENIAMVGPLLTRSGRHLRATVAQLLNGIFEVLCRVWLHDSRHALGWFIMLLRQVNILMIIGGVAVLPSFESTGGAIRSTTFSTSDLSVGRVGFEIELVIADHRIGLRQLILLIVWRGQLLIPHLNLLHVVVLRFMVWKALCVGGRLNALQMLYFNVILALILSAFLSLFSRVSTRFSCVPLAQRRAVRLDLSHRVVAARYTEARALWCW